MCHLRARKLVQRTLAPWETSPSSPTGPRRLWFLFHVTTINYFKVWKAHLYPANCSSTPLSSSERPMVSSPCRFLYTDTSRTGRQPSVLQQTLNSRTAVALNQQQLHVRSNVGMVTPRDALRLQLQTGLRCTRTSSASQATYYMAFPCHGTENLKEENQVYIVHTWNRTMSRRGPCFGGCY